MNMKYSLVFIIVLGLLCGCVRQRKADASDTGSIEMTQSETDALTADSVPLQGAEGTSDSLQGPGNAIYYWKTVFRLTEYDRQFLKKHHIGKSICGCLSGLRREYGWGVGSSSFCHHPFSRHNTCRNRNSAHSLHHHQGNQAGC